MENLFHLLEDQVEVAMVVEVDGTAHNLGKNIALSGQQESNKLLKKSKKIW